MARFAACVDGSEGAQQAFEWARELLPADGALVAVHVSDSRKGHYLPHDLQPEAISADYEAQGAGEVLCEDCATFGPPREALSALLAATAQPSLVVAGNTGRKGPRIASHANGGTARHLLGAAAAGELPCPVVLVKPRAAAAAAAAGRQFVVCVDGSDAAHAAFTLAAQLLRLQDSLRVQHVRGVGVAGVADAELPAQLQQAEIARRYGDIARADRRVSYVEAGAQKGKTAAEALLGLAGASADVVLVGATGAGAFSRGEVAGALGSVAAAVAEGSGCTVGVVPASVPASVGGGGGGAAEGDGEAVE